MFMRRSPNSTNTVPNLVNNGRQSQAKSDRCWSKLIQIWPTFVNLVYRRSQLATNT